MRYIRLDRRWLERNYTDMVVLGVMVVFFLVSKPSLEFLMWDMVCLWSGMVMFLVLGFGIRRWGWLKDGCG